MTNRIACNITKTCLSQGSGPAERLPAIGAGVPLGAAANREKIKGAAGQTDDREPAGDLAGDAGGGGSGGEGSIAEAAERDVEV